MQIINRGITRWLVLVIQGSLSAGNNKWKKMGNVIVLLGYSIISNNIEPAVLRYVYVTNSLITNSLVILHIWFILQVKSSTLIKC